MAIVNAGMNVLSTVGVNANVVKFPVFPGCREPVEG
jgi:hypothetical protein